MSEYKEYPKDIWDYLNDMPYMPSRLDRDQLSKAGEYKRVHIWDYFFQINPYDVGKPQKREIAEIDKRLDEEINRYNNRQKEIRNSIKTIKRILFLMRLKKFLFGFGGFFLSWIISKIIADYQFGFNPIGICSLPFVLYGLVMWISVGFVGWDERNEIKNLKNEIIKLRNDQSQFVKKEIKRKRALDAEIETLKRQIPIHPSGETIRLWLNDDLVSMQDHAIDVTGLGTRLVDCTSGVFDVDGNSVLQKNPIPVLGPAELQHPEKIPPSFSKEINLDLNKHLHVGRSYWITENDKIDVLYGVYYLEYILIGNDMLATCGFFYDFIAGKTYSEQRIEQYYEDVVAIAITNEFRKIILGTDSNETIYIEDAPTFTLSLASGEQRTVTFVSEKYFTEIRDKINVDQKGIPKIFWVRDSKEIAEDAMTALRYYVRLHKGTIGEE